MESINKIEENKKFEIKHYQKVNIFGEIGVGKSSLISHLENYSDDNFKIEKRDINNSQISIASFNDNCSIVEPIKRVEINYNDNNDNLYLSLYETNLDRFDNIKMNLDTLLLQTEFIIFMWDFSNLDSFDNIPKLFSTINAGIKDNKFRDVPIILIQNKSDLEIRMSQKSDLEKENDIKDSIEKIKKENKDIIFKEISLLEKDNIYELVLDITRSLYNYKEKQKDFNDIVNSVRFQYYTKEILEFEIVEKPENKHITINCILLGYSSVGKTTFFNYFYGKTNESNLSTITRDSLLIKAKVHNEEVFVKISDTAGQERFLSITKNYLKDADGILLFFDVTKKESFDKINYWISYIEDEIGKDNSEIILIGNKIDNNEKRVVYKKDAKKKADDYNIKYCECCCLYGLNLYEILNEIIFAGYHKYYEKHPIGIKRRDTIGLKEKERKFGWKDVCLNPFSFIKSKF